MTIVLATGEVKRLGAALRVLAAPLAYADLRSWSAAATQACSAFLGADQALFGMMTADSMVIFAHGGRTEEAALSYMADYWREDFVLTQRRFELGRETYHRDMLYRPGERATCRVYNEWSVPNRMCDTMGMSVEASNPLLAGVHFYHDTETGEFRESGVERLDLLLPAFKAGIHTWLALGDRRRAHDVILDATGDGAILTDLGGRVLHETPALAATLRADARAPEIRAALLQAAATLGALVTRRPAKSAAMTIDVGPVVRELSTAQARYRVVATWLPEGMVAPHAAVASVLRRTTASPLSDTALRDRFALTQREIQVARLIATGRRNSQIATQLGLSPHTALRHTERVLRKLQVHSRAAVAARLTATPGEMLQRPASEETSA